MKARFSERSRRTIQCRNSHVRGHSEGEIIGFEGHGRAARGIGIAAHRKVLYLTASLSGGIQRHGAEQQGGANSDDNRFWRKYPGRHVFSPSLVKSIA